MKVIPTAAETPTQIAMKRCDCAKQRMAAARIREVTEGWPEYAAATLESMAPRTPQQAAALERVKAKPTGSYYLWGFYATGKTHLLIAQYQRLALAGVPCMLRSSRQLADEMRKAEMAPPAGEEPYESPVLRMMENQAHAHVFIDDIEKTPARTDFRAEAAFHWLDTLKRRQHGLTITSNLPLEKLTDYLGDAAVARIMRLCERVEL